MEPRFGIDSPACLVPVCWPMTAALVGSNALGAGLTGSAGYTARTRVAVLDSLPLDDPPWLDIAAQGRDNVKVG